MPAIRRRFGRWRWGAYLYRVQDQHGVDSKIGLDEHVLLWDFDGVALDLAVIALVKVQRAFNLPPIHVMYGGEGLSWHAYCLTRVKWRVCVHILASTEGLCWQFFRYGVMRGKFTLRITAKNGRMPRIIITIPSHIASDVKLEDLGEFVSYESWKA